MAAAVLLFHVENQGHTRKQTQTKECPLANKIYLKLKIRDLSGF